MFEEKLSIILICLVGLTCSGGCEGGQAGLVPVEGSVTLDGEPMAGVQVLFDQPQVTAGKAFVAKTDEQGRYTLRPLGQDRAGGAAGVYRVTLTTAGTPVGAPDDAPPPPERVPPKYRNGKLQYDVPEGGTKDANFDMKSQ